ncbi:hypothetical protein ARMGADRAFT_1067781 [Armillaria gallica]|uniref:Uncharacterized protein n=1 Tax=Armillaria gallica TaxID=47427 RepID=A0A2H3CK84_ARMGA|nr:hypothetical protein ARMGADRAFT_1067781 [Armillaria gallica]
MATTASALSLIIADCTIIWRCWVVWTCNWRAIILPIFFVIGEIVCGVNGVVSEFMAEGEIYETETNWALSLMATTLGTNTLCTTLIVARILYLAGGNRGIMDGIRTYRGVLEIVVESAALYSITFVLYNFDQVFSVTGNGVSDLPVHDEYGNFSPLRGRYQPIYSRWTLYEHCELNTRLVLTILYPIEGNGYMYPQVLSNPVTGIAPTLIVLRVASGQGRPKESSLETQSSLHFQTSRGSTIETATDGREEDTRQGNTGGVAPVLSGSVEQV